MAWSIYEEEELGQAEGMEVGEVEQSVQNVMLEGGGGCSGGAAWCSRLSSLAAAVQREQFQPAHSCGHNTPHQHSEYSANFKVSLQSCANIFGKVAQLTVGSQLANLEELKPDC